MTVWYGAWADGLTNAVISSVPGRLTHRYAAARFYRSRAVMTVYVPETHLPYIVSIAISITISITIVTYSFFRMLCFVCLKGFSSQNR